MTTFQYHADILARYPGVVGGVTLAHDLHNGPTPHSLLTAYQEEQQTVKERLLQNPQTDRRNDESMLQFPAPPGSHKSNRAIPATSGSFTAGKSPLSQLPSLSAWRSAMRAFGVEPTQYRSAAEALLRRLTKKGDIPSINTLVDLGNLVSIRYALPVAVFDTRALHDPVTVHFATGNERYTTLGEEEEEHPEPGEVVFSDATGLVIARRWCWRQSEQSAATLDTTDAIITIEAHHQEARRDIESALADLTDLLKAHAGGTLTSAILDTHHPSITDTARSSK